MIRFQRFLSCFAALMSVFSIHAQTDTLLLNDGRVLVGSYKVSFNHAKVESKTNQNEEYEAEVVKSLSTSKKHYHVVFIHVGGESSHYLAERIVDSKVDLYGVDFPSGYFNANSVSQSFFYFEKEGTFTYVNKSSLEAFYATYFGTCYEAIPKKTLIYNEGSITKMLNAYNRCLNPEAPQQALEPNFNELNLSAFGGTGKLTHYPQHKFVTTGHLNDNASYIGLGLNFVLQRKVRLGFEVTHSKHSVESLIFNSMNHEFKAIGLNLTASYIFRLKKVSLEPMVSVGAGKIYGVAILESKNGIYIDYKPTLPSLPSYEELFYNFNASVKLGYQLMPRVAIFARAGFDVSTTKSIINTDQDVHVMDGLLITGGVSYKIKN